MQKLQGKKVAVIGLGLEGKDLVRYLLEKKAKVTVFDKKQEKNLDFEDIDKNKVKLMLGENYLLEKLSDYEIVFRSPGVYRFLPEMVSAEESGTKITSAIKMFFDLCPSKIIGVTGTKGKGTTAALIYKILKTSGKKAYLAGNIGKSYLELLPKLGEKDLVVLELSSFHLIDLKESPHIAVVLNITEDHMDWHKDKKEYVSSKENIVKHQEEDDYAVICADYKVPESFADLTKAKVYCFSKEKKVNGCYVKDKKIYLSTAKKEKNVGDTKDLLLRGKHNWENVTAAVCAASLAGADLESVKKEVFSFKGLEHRLELVAKVNGITFYNDSFATGPQPTIAAVNSFNEPLTIIMGGSDKGLDYEELGKVVAGKKNVKNALLVGEVSGKIEKSLLQAGYKGKIVDLGRQKMKKIVAKAFRATPEGGVVLLSPAAASFDMFKDYKDRGAKFKKSAIVLKQVKEGL